MRPLLRLRLQAADRKHARRLKASGRGARIARHAQSESESVMRAVNHKDNQG